MGKDCCGGGAPDTEIHLDFMNGTTSKSYSHDHSHDHTHSSSSNSSSSSSRSHDHDHSHASSSSIFVDSEDEKEKKRKKKEKKEKKEKLLAAAAAAEAAKSGYNYSALGLLALFIIPVIFSAGLYIMNIFNPQDPKVQQYKSMVKECYEVANPTNLNKIDEFFLKYKDREYVMLSILSDKYGDEHKECKFRK